MAINHSDCDHPRTPKARAKCRREKAGGTPREVDFSRTSRTSKDDDDNYGQTPRDPHRQCMGCGVEVITHRGTDVLTGMLLFVGDRCLWKLTGAEDLEEVEV